MRPELCERQSRRRLLENLRFFRGLYKDIEYKDLHIYEVAQGEFNRE